MEKILTMHQAIEDLRNSPFVKEKYLGDHISSFNFTRDAFKHNEWNDETIKARGLFIDTRYEVVKARSYDKFFAIGERTETKLDYLKREFNYPVDVYIKENGYLGICSWSDDGNLFCASKSTTEGPYAQRFREILTETLGDKVQAFNDALRCEDMTAVFEVIDPENDSHIIKYNKPQVIFLDLIWNNFMEGEWDDFGCKSYEVLEWWAMKYGLPLKRKTCCLNNANEFEKWYEEVTEIDYCYHGEYVEGFVLRDIDNRMVKVKTDYYNFWKSVRGLVPVIRKGGNINLKWIDTFKHPEIFEIMVTINKWAKWYYDKYGEDISVITIRKLWEGVIWSL